MNWIYKKKVCRRILVVCVVIINILLFPLRTDAAEILFEENTGTESVEGIKESSLYAQSAVLMDADSGRVLYGKNSTDVLPMASTTKIMTLLVALENGNLSDVVTVSSYAASMPDVQLNIREGEQYYLKDLLYSLMLESHNDSAVAIAEGIAGSTEKFAQMMNQKAKEIGCENTTFITPNGLDATAIITGKDGTEREVIHSTTAEDLAKIMSYCVMKSSHKDEFLTITQTASYTFSDCSGKRTFSCRNHNSFLNMMEGAISGKTGFTGKAGYCYVGALERDGRTFVVALLACGWPNNRTYKWKDTKKLMEYGIENYEYAYYETAAKEIPQSGQIPVVEGQTEKIGDTAYVEWGVAGKALSDETTEMANMGTEAEESGKEGVLLRKDEKIDVKWDVKDVLQAPVKEGTKVGYIRYLIGEETYKEEELIVLKAVERINYDWCMEKVIERFLLFK